MKFEDPAVGFSCLTLETSNLKLLPIGFVLHDWLQPRPRLPVRGQIGFVLHNRLLRGPPDPGGLRPFPRARRQLASFRTSHFSRLGFVSHEFSPPRHRGHGAGAGLSPAISWGLSLRSRCLCGVGATHASPVRLQRAGGQRSSLHWSCQTRRVPDPAHRCGHLRRRPRFYDRRLSTPVCCAIIKNHVEIFHCPTSPARRAKDNSPGIHPWGTGAGSNQSPARDERTPAACLLSFAPAGLWGSTGPPYPPLKRWAIVGRPNGTFWHRANVLRCPAGGCRHLARAGHARGGRAREICRSPPARGQAWANSMRAGRCGVAGLLPTASSVCGSSRIWYDYPVDGKKARTKKFDAVAESRKWEEAVAKETEGMTPDEVVAYFDRAAVRRRFDAALRRAKQAGKAEDERRK